MLIPDKDLRHPRVAWPKARDDSVPQRTCRQCHDRLEPLQRHLRDGGGGLEVYRKELRERSLSPGRLLRSFSEN